MKTTLTQTLLLRLAIDTKPHEGSNGKLEFIPNPTRKLYILYDDHRDAPTGFAIKLSTTKKTYIIQRRIGKSVLKVKVGNVSDFTTIDAARKKARDLIQIALEIGRNPNEVARDKSSSDITIEEAFAQYRIHLLGRSKPAKPNTLKVFDKALTRIAVWQNTRIKDLSAQEILEKFDSIALLTRTATEQTFRWANVATNYAIEMEAHNAASQQRQPTLNLQSIPDSQD
jgi:hypothetical protein